MANMNAQKKSIFEQLLKFVTLAGKVAGYIPETHFQAVSKVISAVSADLVEGSGPSEKIGVSVTASDPGSNPHLVTVEADSQGTLVTLPTTTAPQKKTPAKPKRSGRK